MSDQIREIIERDLNRLPLLSQDRWVPQKAHSRGGVGWLALAGACLVVLAAVAVGSGLRTYRTGTAEHPASAPTPTVALPERLARQEVLRLIRNQTAELPRVTHIEAKLVDRQVASSIHPNAVTARPPEESSFWVVAVAGDIRVQDPSRTVMPAGAPTDQVRSIIYVVGASSGDIIGAAASTSPWPQGFEPLRDGASAATAITVSATVVALELPDRLIVDIMGSSPGTPSGRLTLRADQDTAYDWTAGVVGGTAHSLEEMSRYLASGRLVAVRIEPMPDGSYRLEHLVNVTR